MPVGMGMFVAALLVLGCWITWREFRRLTRKSLARKVFVKRSGNVTLTDNVAAAVPDLAPDLVPDNDHIPANHSRRPHAEHRSFESSWLARRLENEDWVA